jgi:hypothetical protein
MPIGAIPGSKFTNKKARLVAGLVKLRRPQTGNCRQQFGVPGICDLVPIGCFLLNFPYFGTQQGYVVFRRHRTAHQANVLHEHFDGAAVANDHCVNRGHIFRERVNVRRGAGAVCTQCSDIRP